MRPLFSPEELAELARADAEIEAEFRRVERARYERRKYLRKAREMDPAERKRRFAERKKAALHGTNTEGGGVR